MPDGGTGTIIAVVLSAAFTLIAQIYREGRQRKWDQEDRKILAVKVDASAKALETTVRRASDGLALKATKDTSSLLSAVESVGHKADSAYKEANHVNNKISDLNAQLLSTTIQKAIGGGAAWAVGQAYQLSGMTPAMWHNAHTRFGQPASVAGRYLGGVIGTRTWHIFEIQHETQDIGVLLLTAADAALLTIEAIA